MMRRRSSPGSSISPLRGEKPATTILWQQLQCSESERGLCERGAYRLATGKRGLFAHKLGIHDSTLPKIESMTESAAIRALEQAMFHAHLPSCAALASILPPEAHAKESLQGGKADKRPKWAFLAIVIDCLPFS
jgi:hypothetical protein